MSGRSFSTPLPAHESIVARAYKIRPSDRHVSTTVLGILGEALTTSYPKGHGPIEEALYAMRTRLAKGGKKFGSTARIRFKTVLEKLAGEVDEADRKAAEKAARPIGGDVQAGKLDLRPAAGNGVAEGTAVLHEADVVALIDGFGPGTPNVTTRFVGFVGLYVPQDEDGYPLIEAQDPAMLAKSWKTLNERLTGMLDASEAEIVGDGIDYLEAVAAGKVNEPAAVPARATPDDEKRGAATTR